MAQHKESLKPFDRRVRLVRSWRGLAVGASFGSLIAVAWAALDWANVAYAQWSGLAAVVGAGAVVGFAVGLLQKIRPGQLADSIDRRAELEDRLVTSIEREGSEGVFDSALHSDAQAHLEGLRPAKLYPVRLGKWHASAVALAALASAIFLLGNTPIFMSEQQRHDRTEVKQAGQTVEHVLKPVEQHPELPSNNADDKRLAEALRRLSHEMEKARISKEEAMQKANEIQKQAQQLVKDRAAQAEQTLAKAESAFEKMAKDEQAQKLGQVDPELAKLSDAERESRMDAISKQMDSTNQRISDLQRQMGNKGASDAQKQQLSKELQDLLNQQKKLSQQMEQLKLSKNVQDMLRRMMENPLYKKLLEMQKKLEDAMKDAQQNGEQQKLTHEQIEQMQKELEELAKKLKDDKALTDYLQKLIDAMKQGCGT